MKIVALSDTHGDLLSVKKLPEGDVLCIPGDIVPLEIQSNKAASIAWFCMEFLPWVEKLPYKYVILVGGNHDFFLYYIGPYIGRDADYVLDSLIPKTQRKRFKKLRYLCDSGCTIEINGKRVKFWGTPWCAELDRWAFYLPNKAGSNPYWEGNGEVSVYENLEHKFSQIPSEIDIIITHMPPKVGTAGQVLEKYRFNTGSDYGSPELRDALARCNYKYLLCGHVHSGCHEPIDFNGGKVVNVSLKGEDYKQRYEPFVFEV